MDLFKDEDLEKVLARINILNDDSVPHWGSMSREQMLAHCTKVLEVAINPYEKQLFIGKLFGAYVIKKILKNKEMKKGIKSSKVLFEEFPNSLKEEKERLISTFKQFHDKGPEFYENKLHPFFGRLTAKQWNELTYKHLNHHLNQFGC